VQADAESILNVYLTVLIVVVALFIATLFLPTKTIGQNKTADEDYCCKKNKKGNV